MSKVYDKYLQLKEEDAEKLYLFKNGNFYIFIAEDADYINNYVVLKRVKFTKEVFKCGFPINALDDYLRVFNNHNLKIEIIESISEENVIDYIKSIDINNITPLKALEKLSIIKEMVKNEQR